MTVADQPDPATFPVLQPDMPLHVCLTCGSVVPEKALVFHDRWHTAIADAAIEALRR